MTTNEPSARWSDSTLLLQRRLSAGDCCKWRTVLAFTPEQAQDVELLVAAARRIDSAVLWRVRPACAPSAGQTLTSTEG